jgi:hypothetical protein
VSASVWFIARTQARRRWRALVALALFVGLIGGLSLSLIAGSRRSASVVDRYFAAGRQYTFEFFAPGISHRQLLAIPGVVRADPSAYLGTTARMPDRSLGGINGLVVDFSAADPTTRVLSGHIPDGSDPSAVVVNEAFVQQFGRTVGDMVNVRMFGRDQADQVSRGVYKPHGPRYTMRIAGLARLSQDIAGDEVRSEGVTSASSPNGMLVSNTFYDAHRDEFLDFGEGFSIRLRNGLADRSAFLAAVNAQLPAGADRAVTAPVNGPQRRASLEAPVDLETTALLALGIGLAFVGALATSLVLRAEQRAHEEDAPALRTLGCTVPQLASAAVLRGLPVALGGAFVAGAIALALSARYPIGIGRELELHRGFDVNLSVIGLGILAIIAFVVGISFVLGRPRRVRDPLPTSRLTMARWLAQVGAPTNLALGAQLAFERGRGVRSVPSRQAILGGAAALAIVTSVAVYVGGVDHLYGTPTAHGWAWTAAIGNTNFPLLPSTARELAHDGRVKHQTVARYGDAKVNGRDTEMLAFDSRGDAPPEVIAGRIPETASEIALGRGTLDALGVDVDSTVTFSVAGGEFQTDQRPTPRRMRVVGVALSPIFGEAELGEAGIITLDGVESAGGDRGAQFVLVDLKQAHRSTVLSSIDRDYTEEIVTDAVAARIVNLHRVRRLPLLGLLLAGFLGTILLVYTLTISARARMHELAVLRALGLRSKRVRAVLTWQGALLAVGMLVIGIPVGLLAGSAIWNAVADDLGVADAVVLSPLILLLVPLALVVAIVASLYPSRRARRAPVATALRVE